MNDKNLDLMEKQLKKIYVGQKALKEKRPILNQVHTYDNFIEITNSHVAARIETDNEYKDNIENYPSLNRLFEISNDYQELRIESSLAKEIEQYLDIFVKEKVTVVEFTFLNNEGINISSDSDLQNIHIDYDFKNKVGSIITFKINPRYFRDSLNFFRKFKTDFVTLHFLDKVHPLFLTHENIEYILMPIRKD